MWQSAVLCLRKLNAKKITGISYPSQFEIYMKRTIILEMHKAQCGISETYLPGLFGLLGLLPGIKRIKSW